MSTSKEQAVSSELLDLKAINEKLETLPHDSLMYVAGAIAALAAAIEGGFSVVELLQKQ